jgi:ketosteroid isomerase-like protein
MHRTFITICGVLAVALAITTPGTALADVADEIIAITRAQWAAEMQKDPATAMKNVADEYTEFSLSYPTRLDGKALNLKLAEVQAASDELIAAEMANEKVQVYGDTAILTYNFVGASRDKAGVISPLLAKSTRVYVKKGNRWMLVHANFGSAE